ncbi:MAG: Pr6Pr family membrane protein [Clostridiales bacterium]|jgi:hypothetical protein|nr:Pr6Pr family membrane protein [Clostridiales bacterium]
MIKNRLTALIFRGASFLLCLAGILDTAGAFKGRFSFSVLLFYTVMSNILILVLFGALLCLTARDMRRNGIKGPACYRPRVVFVCMIDILLTFGVYWVMLAPQAFTMGEPASLLAFSNLTVHAVVPLLCAADLFLFAPAGHIRLKDLAFSLVFPLFYVALATVLGFSGYVFFETDAGPVHFPYFFLDYHSRGGMVAVYILALIAVFMALGLLFYGLDRLRVKKSNGKEEH